MSISVQVDEARQIVTATAQGQLGFSAFREFIHSVRTGERRSWTLIFDMTEAATDITDEQIWSLSVSVGEAMRTEGLRATAALIAPDDELFDRMKLYRILCEEQGVNAINVFRTRQEADAWLGI